MGVCDVYKTLIIVFCFFAIGSIPAADYRTPCTANSLCVADLDLDGDQDIVIGHNYGWMTFWSGISILTNDGYGHFFLTDSLYLKGGQPCVQAVDLFGASNPEIIVKRYATDTDSQYIDILQDFDFQSRASIFLPRLEYLDYVGVYTTADMDGDGWQDIVFASRKVGYWGIIGNLGDGSFVEPVYFTPEGDFRPRGAWAADLDGDQSIDLLFSGNPTLIFLNDNGDFVSTELPIIHWDASIGDFDGDGDEDIVGLSSWGHQSNVVFHENLGNGEFASLETILFEPQLDYILTSDLNGDDLPDFVLTGHYSIGFFLLFNLGGFALSEPVFCPVMNHCGEPLKGACADFDEDGDMDIAIIEYSPYPIPNLHILFNDGMGQFDGQPDTGVSDDNPPSECILFQNYPNPFNETTWIRIDVEADFRDASIAVYDINGRIVQMLFNGSLSRGCHTCRWDGRDSEGRRVGSGLYQIRVSMDEQYYGKKIILTR